MDSSCPIMLFDQFVAASTFKSILQTFNRICTVLRLDPLDVAHFYQNLKTGLSGSWKAEKLWLLLDKKASQKEYEPDNVCSELDMLIIGAGPCGLRAAIECRFLGAHVVLVEKRDYFSRNNVLHIWPFIIHDLKNLGIRQLQCILLKVALILGVEIHEGVSFDSLIVPEKLENHKVSGWRANFLPCQHFLSHFEFDVLIGADGKRNTIPGFPRRELRGKLAIGITANFINRRTEAEEKVAEISGVAFIFNQQFFKDMKTRTGVDLENIVYYKDETHYFVMCAKKQSLLDKAVLIHDWDDVMSLLSPANISQSSLLDYAREAADFATVHRLPHLDLASDHLGRPDVAMFDFTSLFSAECSVRLVERKGRQLLLTIVGDSLHEVLLYMRHLMKIKEESQVPCPFTRRLCQPFWPTGSGCARGFLSVFDTIWMIRSYGLAREGPLELMAQRESVYRLLAQTTVENLHRNTQNYTIDPSTRYTNVDVHLRPEQISHLIDTDDPRLVHPSSPHFPLSKHSLGPERNYRYCRQHRLLRFIRLVVGWKIDNFSDDWKDGRAICTILSRFRPEFDEKSSLESALDFIENEFHLNRPCSSTEWPPESDKFETFLQHFVDILMKNDAQFRSTLLASSIISPSPTKQRHRSGKHRKSSDKMSAKVLVRTGQLIDSLSDRDSGTRTAGYSDTQCSWTKRPLVEKLNPERLFGVEEIINGNVASEQTKQMYRDKRRQAQIVVRKLHSKELQDMEAKLERTGMGLLFDREQFKTMTSKEELVLRANAAEARRLANNGFRDDANREKHREIDDKIDRASQLLKDRNLTGLDIVSRTMLGQQRITRTPPIPPPRVKTASIAHSPSLEDDNVQMQSPQCRQLCHLCGQLVFLAERVRIDGLVVHRRCFRCSFCHRTLRLCDSGLDGKKFYCMKHLNLSASEKLRKLEEPMSTLETNPDEISTEIIDEPKDWPLKTTQMHSTHLNSSSTKLAKTMETMEITTTTNTEERAEFQCSPEENDDTHEDRLELQSEMDIGMDDYVDAKLNVHVGSPSHFSSERSSLSGEQMIDLENALMENDRLQIPSFSIDRASRLVEQWTNGSNRRFGMNSDSAGFSVREQKVKELTDFKKEARLKAKLKSDEEIGLDSDEKIRSIIRTWSLVENSPCASHQNNPELKFAGLFSRIFPQQLANKLATNKNDISFCSENTKETSVLSKFALNRYKNRHNSSPEKRQKKTAQNGNENGQNRRQCNLQDELQSRTALITLTPEIALTTNSDDILGKKMTCDNDKLVKRVQRAAEKLVKRHEENRQRKAQDIQRRLQENEVRIIEVDSIGVQMEKRLVQDPENRWVLDKWLLLVLEKDQLTHLKSDLKLRATELELQNKHSRLQMELKSQLIDKELSNSRQLKEEQELLQRMLAIVTERDAIVNKMETLKPPDDVDTDEILAQKCYSYMNFDPVFLADSSSIV